MALIEPGTLAPDFSVKTTTGETVTLSDLRGKKNVVLYFYPEDDTPGCTVEACAFRDDRPKFDAADTVIWGVSLDNEDAHKRFTEKFHLNFPLLADVDGKICEAYGVPVEDNWPHRITYLIGKDGRIIHTYGRVAVQVHSRELLELLATVS